MAENSKIQWTTHTFNHVRGCVEYAPGCDNCYAAAMSKRNPKTLGVWGSEKAGGTRIVASEEQWKNLKKWNDAAHELSIDPVFFNEPRPRVFVASLADVFEDWQGPMLNAKEERLFVRRDGLWNDDGSGDAGHAVYPTKPIASCVPRSKKRSENREMRQLRPPVGRPLHDARGPVLPRKMQ